MAALSNAIPLQIAPAGPYRDHARARRMDGFARTLDVDWTEIGVDQRQAQHRNPGWHGGRAARDPVVAVEPPIGFAAQMIAQGMGKGAHLENFGGVSLAYRRTEHAPYAPRRGAGLSFTI